MAREDEKNLAWRTCRPDGESDKDRPIPDAVFAACPPQLPMRLPFEIALLLPTQKLRDPVPPNHADPEHVAAALFLANPLLNADAWVRHFQARGVGWIANFPSITQHEFSFRGWLTDVGLGFEKELSLLSTFARAGFRTLACVTDAGDAHGAVSAGCDALMVVPQVPAFEAGFPSVQHRQTQLLAIRAEVAGAEVPILGLLQPAEAALTSTWPRGMNAGLARPSGPVSA